jgi:hypothetical protein
MLVFLVTTASAAPSTAAETAAGALGTAAQTACEAKENGQEYERSHDYASDDGPPVSRSVKLRFVRGCSMANNSLAVGLAHASIP